MPVRRRADRRRVATLSHDAYWSLMLGGSREQAFTDETERRQAWDFHRDGLLDYARSVGGWRPSAWWDYEASAEYPGQEAEAQTLFAMGELSDAEIEKLRRDHAHLPAKEKPAFLRT